MSSLVRHYGTFTAARANLRGVLDAAREGLVTTVQREHERYVVLRADAFRRDLATLLPANATVLAEGGGWSAVLPGVPVHGDADSFDGAVDDLVEALREYAEDWNVRLRRAPNHEGHRLLVELVELSDDGQLRDWILGRGPDGAPGPGATA